MLVVQTARIGEATTDLYPSFHLLGSIDLDTIDSADLAF